MQFQYQQAASIHDGRAWLLWRNFQEEASHAAYELAICVPGELGSHGSQIAKLDSA